MQRFFLGLVEFAFLCAIGVSSLDAQDAKPSFTNAASPADAAKQLDLSEFPLLDGSEAPSVQQVTSLAYQVKAGPKPAYGQVKKQLTDRGWKEESGSSVTDEYASGVFTKNGYHTSVTIMPSTPPDIAVVRLQHHGNISLAKLPAGPDSKPVYVGPLSAIYNTPNSAENTADWIRETLTKAGWEPYGGNATFQEFRNRGVILTTLATDAVAPDKGSNIQYSTRMVSVEIPAPPDAEQIQFADDSNQLSFDAKSDSDAIADFYRESLAKHAWKATTENWIQDKFSKSMIFRNEAGDLLLMEHKDIEGKSRLFVKHQTAAAVEEEGKRFQAAKEKAMKEKNAPKDLLRVKIAIPEGVQGDTKSGTTAQWTVPNGSAIKLAKAIRQALEKDGWKEASGTLDPLAGVLLLEKKDATITIDYTDTGFLPAEFNIRASQCELDFK
ncbi:MAG: hypothetical protein WCI02_09360 [Planctomycetota bacterium]